MALLQRVENAFVKGILVSLPVAILSILIASLVSARTVRIPNILLLSCYPTTSFCLPLDRVITFLLLVAVALLCSLYFVKTTRQRALFTLGFCLLFWFFQSALAVIAFIVALLIGRGF